MKTLLTTLFTLLISSLVAGAQTVMPKDWLLSGGTMINRYGNFPIVANVERGLSKGFSVGGRLMTVASTDDVFDEKIRLIFLGATGNFHPAELLNLTSERLDPYAGATMGVGIISYYDFIESTPILLNLQVGTRYYFNKSIAAYGQINLGTNQGFGTNIELGLTYRLRK